MATPVISALPIVHAAILRARNESLDGNVCCFKKYRHNPWASEADKALAQTAQ